MWEHNLPRNRPRNVVSPANFLAWRERSRSFDGMAAFTQNRVTLTGAGEPQELATLIVTANILDVLGVGADARPRVRGRRRSRRSAARTMVLSHAAWLRQFGGDASVIGQQVDDQRRAGDGHRRDAARLRDLRLAGGCLHAVPAAGRKCRSAAAA